MNIDYIIVGCGLAGIAFSEQLIKHNKSFIVFDDDSQQSSVVAGGVYNPVVLKRFNAVWKSKEMLDLVTSTYKTIEDKLEINLDYKVPVLRRFTSLEEQNDWFIASDKPNLTTFLSTTLEKNNNDNIDAPFDYGKVLHTGRLDTKVLVKHYKSYLKKENHYIKEKFEHNKLLFKGLNIHYNTITAKHIIFAEGYGLKGNPFFNHLPMEQAKGELLTLKAPELKLTSILKANIFIIPLGNDLYRIGSTYDWVDDSNTITEKAKLELLRKFEAIVKCNYEVVNQVAGIRPTVRDRRPLVGRHEEHKACYILNGLGTRGVMIGPYVAKQLYHFIENDEPLEREINIDRFTVSS